MPNTKSAERRMRNSVRKHASNQSTKSKLKTLEKSYLSLVNSGKKEDGGKALRSVSAALDKAVKTGVMHRGAANRKKSRLAARLNRVK